MEYCLCAVLATRLLACTVHRLRREGSNSHTEPHHAHTMAHSAQSTVLMEVAVMTRLGRVRHVLQGARQDALINETL